MVSVTIVKHVKTIINIEENWDVKSDVNVDVQADIVKPFSRLCIFTSITKQELWLKQYRLQTSSGQPNFLL